MQLTRRRLLLAGGAAAAASALPFAVFARQGEDARLTALLDRWFYEDLDRHPERATSLGLDKGERAGLKARLDDRSAAAHAAEVARSSTRVQALKGFERARLGPEAQVDLDVMAYQEGVIATAGRRFTYGAVGNRFAPYVISQLTGAYQNVPDFLDNQHKVETAEDADAYLARLKAFAVTLDQDLARTRADAGRGVAAPDFALDSTLAQLQALRGQPAADTVLVRSLARKAKDAGLEKDFEARAVAIVEGEVFPALDRQIAAVRALRAKAPGDAGVWRLPDGEAYYAAAVNAATTTTLTPDEIHQMGLEQVAEITSRLDALLKAQGKTQGTVGERLAALNDDPAQLYPNTDEGRQAIIDQLNRQIDAMYLKLPQAFGDIPKAKVVVKRVPVFIQDGAPNGYYQRAALDGSRPALYFINLKDTHEWPKFSLPTLTYHEAVPGHHLQISIQQEATGIPLIRRTALFSAYAEGWALYAEQLASELGVYQGDPWGEAGFLQSFLFRAVRLVVDSGMHAKRWSREKATDYMVDKTGYAKSRCQREIDRYVVWPGQACSYKVGHTVWTRVREQARRRLGAAFDLKAFHDTALHMGAMPLTVLESLMAARLTA
jgi:uncharacterized protein (DUF885 family)